MTRVTMLCADCDVNTSEHDGIAEYYMVNFDLWNTVAPSTGRGSYLCIGCLEARIGRELCRDDFIGAPVNRLEHGVKSERLRDRLTREADSYVPVARTAPRPDRPHQP